jgi:hypothetical protein
LTDAIFGSLRGPTDVERAVLNTLKTWLPTMLRVLERREGLARGTLRPPPGYGQWFEVEVSTTHIEETEDDARVIAGRVGVAVMAAIIQNGSLGGLASRTELVSAPTVAFTDPDKRRVAQSLTTFHVFVDGLVSENAGTNTPTPPDSPQYPGNPTDPFHDWPVVVTPSVTLVAEPPE